MNYDKCKEITIQGLKDWLNCLEYKGYDEVDEDDLDFVLEYKSFDPEVKKWIDNLPRKDFNSFFGDIQETMAEEWDML